MNDITKYNNYSSDDISERIGSLFKEINLKRFAEEHSIARKSLYKIKDSGIIPRDILFAMCDEANINPVLVYLSPTERLIFFNGLVEYIKNQSVDELYKNIIDSIEVDNTKLTARLSLLQELFASNEITPTTYQKQLQNILFSAKK